MPTRRFAAAALVLALAVPGTAGAWFSMGRSTTQIPAGQTFVLGGGQGTPLRVSGRNSGPVAIVVEARSEAGVEPLVRLEPGERFSQLIPARVAVLLRNTSDTREAQATLEFNSSVSSLSMSYQQNR